MISVVVLEVFSNLTILWFCCFLEIAIFNLSSLEVVLEVLIWKNKQWSSVLTPLLLCNPNSGTFSHVCVLNLCTDKYSECFPAAYLGFCWGSEHSRGVLCIQIWSLSKGNLKITALTTMISICIMELISAIAHPSAPFPVGNTEWQKGHVC